MHISIFTSYNMIRVLPGAAQVPLKKYNNPFKPDFTIVIFIHYKPRIAVAILDLWWMKMT